MNKAEEIVTKLCKRTFLSLWSYPNPRKKDSDNELCDLLVVCNPDIIIFSVKEIKVTDSGDISVDWDRWQKKAIEKSVNQIYGAERHINQSQMKHVTTKDGQEGLPIPDPSVRKIHRVAVALGSKGKVPRYSGDPGKGFVHVFDEASFEIILKELDTITDFVHYLRHKETFLSKQPKKIMLSGEEDLLAVYLENNRSFPSEYNFIFLDEGIWEHFSKTPHYLNKKKEDQKSYLWDNIIEDIGKYVIAGTLKGGTREDFEKALRVLARENRVSRRILSKYFVDFLGRKGRSRFLTAISGVVYVFLARLRGTDRRERAKELSERCFIVRGLSSDATQVIGIATESYEEGKPHSYDICNIKKDDWSTKDQILMKRIQENTGYFIELNQIEIKEKEYPDVQDEPQKETTPPETPK